MKSPVILLASLCLAAASLAETAKNLAIDPKPRDGNWVKRHESFNEVSKKGEVQLVFLGDSITQGWEGNGKEAWAKTWAPLKAANFGIGGDRTEHVIWRLQNGNFDGIKPKLIVLMIGTNNTGHQGRPAAEHGGVVYTSSAEQTAEGVKMILDILGKKLPETKVLLLGIFPRGATKDDAVYVFTKDGKFVRSMLPQMKGGGHGLDITVEQGPEAGVEDDVEVLYHCDVNRRRVLKTTLDGAVLWEKGAPVEAEFEGKKIYANENDWNPTNVAFHPNGDIFVGDGYGKSFVHIFSKDGAWKQTIAGPGSGEGQVSGPHGLWWDDRVGTLAVADRSNNRIQYFAENGAGKPWKHVSFVKDAMRQPCHFKTRGDLLLVPDLSSAVELLGKDNKAVAVLGDGHPTNLRGAARKDFIPGKFVHPHSATFLADGSILVVEWVPIGRVTRLVKV